jgi:hypothetical protein
MQILVLDTIHGGKVIADHLSRLGHDIDMVDVYRGQEGIFPEIARSRSYDLVVAPVHLDPDYALLHEISSPVISHHAAVRWILGNNFSKPVVEITGKQGKSTTATALAFLLQGPGLLQTSSGLFRYPEKEEIGRYSITPASLLTTSAFIPPNGWFIVEISIGFCGIGSLGIITSGLDYSIANEKRSAFTVKSEQSHVMEKVLVAPGVLLQHTGAIFVKDLITIEGSTAYYNYLGITGEFSNPLLTLPGYQTPLMLAAGAALLLGIKPDKLSEFTALPCRMEVFHDDGYVIIDNGNSGTCLATTMDSFRYGKEIVGDKPVTIIIGQESASVCENFTTEEIISSIEKIRPQSVILIPGDKRIMSTDIIGFCESYDISCTLVVSPEEGIKCAKCLNNPLILLSVKRWK